MDDFCYVDHSTGESDHMNAHIRTKECDMKLRTKPRGKKSAKSKLDEDVHKTMSQRGESRA